MESSTRQNENFHLQMHLGKNGATEALIKPIKRAVNNAIGEEVMSSGELQTVMFEAAQLVN